MTTDRIAAPPRWRTSASWAGRSSHLRREQVRRGAGLVPAASTVAAEELWHSLTDVLRAIEAPSSALLCTPEGHPMLAYALADSEVDAAARSAGSIFAGRGLPRPGVVTTLEVESGGSQTVIATVPSATHDHLLLSVTAEGVSMPVLEAWTRQAAEDLREVLSAQ